MYDCMIHMVELRNTSPLGKPTFSQLAAEGNADAVMEFASRSVGEQPSSRISAKASSIGTRQDILKAYALTNSRWGGIVDVRELCLGWNIPSIPKRFSLFCRSVHVLPYMPGVS